VDRPCESILGIGGHIDEEHEDSPRADKTDGGFEMKASEYLKMISGGSEEDSNSNGLQAVKNSPRSATQRKVNALPAHEQEEERPKRSVGRPKGSRTYGVTALRKVNRNVTISDDLMGERCGVNNCSVRLKVCRISQLRLQRREETDPIKFFLF